MRVKITLELLKGEYTMKIRVLLLVTGVLIGIVLSIGVFYIYTIMKPSNCDCDVSQDYKMQFPEMMNGQNGDEWDFSDIPNGQNSNGFGRPQMPNVQNGDKRGAAESEQGGGRYPSSSDNEDIQSDCTNDSSL